MDIGFRLRLRLRTDRQVASNEGTLSLVGEKNMCRERRHKGLRVNGPHIRALDTGGQEFLSVKLMALIDGVIFAVDEGCPAVGCLHDPPRSSRAAAARVNRSLSVAARLVSRS